MLSVFCILFFLCIACLSYKKTYSILHPAVIVSLLWALLLLAYSTLEHGLYPLSDNFFWAILLWVSGFSIGALWIHDRKLKFPPPLCTRKLKISLLKQSLLLFIFINVIGSYEYYKLNGGFAYYAFVQFALGEEDLPLKIRLLSILQLVSLTLYSIMTLYGKQAGISRKLILLHSVTLFVWVVIQANKTGVMQFVAISTIAVCMRNKLSFSKISVVAFIFLLSMLFLHNLRTENAGGDKSSMKDMLQVYILSPMPAFDMVLNGEKEFTPGRTWRFFAAVGNRIGITKKYDSGESGWVNVPVPTNVYTVMFPYYVDFGYYGLVIFSLILGFGWGMLYNGVKRKIPFFTILYCTFFHTLILQFFADYMVNYMSTIIQINIFCAILLLHYKTISRRKLFSNIDTHSCNKMCKQSKNGY